MSKLADYTDIFEKPSFAHLATLMPDGSPQVTPVWVDRQGETILVNSAEGRLKDRNVRNNPHVAISVCDPDNPYRMVSVRGRVAEITKEGAEAHIDALAKRYLGKDQYPFRAPGEVRVIYRIVPDKVAAQG